VRLTVIGCSGSYPGPDSPASCYLVEAPYDGGTFRLLLDLGNGSLGPLQRHAPLDDIDAVVLSHLHADHCLDMCSFYVARRYLPAGPMARIPVYGPTGTADRMALAYGLDPDPGMHEEFAFTDHARGPVDLGPFTLRTVRVNHPVEAYAVRIERDGRSLVYSGDTGPCNALVELARGADLLLCEASFQDGRDTAPDLHLNGREAAEHATRAGVGRLLLTHVPPWNDPARSLAEAVAAFAGGVELARAGAVVEI
jgi:ribonuclease BN (tRNA processing enzyme)